MTRVHTKLAGPMFSIKSADLNRTAFSATKTSTPMYQNRWNLAYCIPANRRRVVLYGSATFFSHSPIDCIHFTKDVPRRSWPQNLDFDCTFRPELEPSVPLIDLLYWVVDDFRAAKIKIWLADTYYRTDRVGDKAQQKTVEALKHFLSYSKSDTTFILPSCFEPSVKNLKNGSSGKVTFKFLEDNTSDENI
ncbi:unnamed protein product [Fusarium graminearum]|uniref:Uncharacterized protein n=1 Tax=Gibberella zeae (strain ATCC MYA-4620 / CBS 123657 / FGSC 9075 / NRRL 31084 / PH-1) TaxID=229533 RepID=I1SAP2_GIBZE|nr:hypothetical protein FGSG_13923 [Fusarium graminearum PH-1]ESU18029.1 hypothetical protein FGSG_13923 [Fusarium graminearum PH-1]EYB34158.1 hypothetical protein FG05_13923 [Fusarium graminearum]KAI6768903.1 hypothetical protein HG531_011092 [Fusarium graminearum]CZS85286.1 unnamed protein product [Fusarium graminearum]|eukprot:XP_011325651.1 hypothetical protein FGSG_13923 [Fusarium graminearum PH-1]